MKRLVRDALGNYLFFCPIVVALTPALHNVGAVEGYLLASLPIALVGGPLYTRFLPWWNKHWGSV